MVGVKEVKELSERTKKKGRACHVAFNVSQEDYDVMFDRIPNFGGRSSAISAPPTACVHRENATFIFSTPTPIICKSPPSEKKTCR